MKATRGTSSRRFWVPFLVGGGSLLLVGAFRFAHVTPDSSQYLAMAEAFAGGVPAEQLRAPFAYRPLVPLLVAAMPVGSLVLRFGLLNLLFTGMALAVQLAIAHRLEFSQRRKIVVALFFSLSFPVFNYATGVLSDPCGLLVFALAFWATLERAWIWLLATLCVGVFVRDASLLAVLPAWSVLLLDSRDQRLRNVLIGLGLVLLPLLLYLLLRSGVDSALGGSPYVWKVSVKRLAINVGRPISLATCTAALGPALVILAVRRRAVLAWWLKEARALRALIAVSLLMNVALVVYSSFSAFLSGRFVWPAYISLTLLVAVALTPAENRS